MRLHELPIVCGSKLTISMLGQDYKSHKFGCQFVGYQQGDSLFLAVKSKPGQVLLHTGIVLTVEGRLPAGVFSFESKVEQVIGSSCTYLRLEYPVACKFDAIRQHIRIKTDTPVEVTGQTDLGMSTSSITGYMMDVSYGGARIVLEKEITAMVTSLNIGVQLSAGGLERDMKLVAEVRNDAALSEDYPECGFAYGIEFIKIEDVDDLFLRCFCLNEKERGRALLC